MIELHLIGYTSDLRYLVLDLEPEGERGRYRLVVDGDLLLTLDELRDLRAQAGMDVGIPYERLEERLGIVIGGDRQGSTTADADAAPEEPTEWWEPVTARPPTSQPPPAPLREEPAPPDEEPARPREEPAPPAVRVVDRTGPSVEEREAAPWGGAVDEATVGSGEEEQPEEPGELDGSEDPEEPDRPEEPESPEDPAEPDDTDDIGGSDEPDEPDEVGEPGQVEEPEEIEEPDGTPDGGERPAAQSPRRPASAGGTSDAAAPGRDSELTPAQIQARLRAGRRPESVAEEAGTDVAWVERWLPPILTERAQVLQEARSLYLERPRKGRSHAPLGEAVAANLRRRHLDPDEDAEWSVKRRANGRWSINVRYRYRNKTRSATWALDREEGELTASSKAARDLGWTDGG